MAKPVPTDISDDVKARFWAKVDVRGPDECWPWTGYKTPKGYGRSYVPGLSGNWAVHRLALALHMGAPDPVLVTDHICRNPSCCNPRHLRAITNVENVLCGESIAARNARKTHCVRGHPFSGDNLGREPGNGQRYCRACKSNALTTPAPAVSTEEIVEVLENTRQLVAACCPSGFTDPAAVEALFLNNAVLSATLSHLRGEKA